MASTRVLAEYNVVDTIIYYRKALESVSQDDLNCYPENSYGSGPWDMEQLKKDTDGRMRASVLDGVGIQFVWMRNSEPPFDDPKVRRAIYISINRPEGVKAVFRGFGVPGTFFSPGFVEDPEEFAKANLPGYAPDRTADLAEAKRLLAEAGYPDGLKDITINTLNSGTSKVAAEQVASQLRRDGIADITLDAVDLATMYVKMRDGAHAMSLVGTGIIITDPGDIINQFFLQDVLRNPENFSDPRLENLIPAQNKEQDPVKRRALIKEFADVLMEGESHIVPLWWYPSGSTFDYRLRNWHAPQTVQLIHKWDHVWWDPDAKKLSTPGYVP